MNDNIQETSTVSFGNDLFFKYAFSRDNDISVALRKKLIYLISGIKCKELIVRNPEINQSHVDAKNIILDVLIKDENNHPIDIKIQMYNHGTTEKKRFQFYGARMLVNQLEQGRKYYELNKVYQYILINEYNPHHNDLIECYMFRNNHNEIEPENLNECYYVFMKESKKKKSLNDLERLCSLFINNEYSDIIKEDKEDIIRQVVEMYDEFKKDKKMWDLGNERELALIREESLKMEYEDRVKKGIEEGIKQGVKQGLKQGVEQGYTQGINAGKEQGMEAGIESGKIQAKRDNCIRLIKKKYDKDSIEWVESLNEKQLDEIINLIMEENNYDLFKQKVELFK